MAAVSDSKECLQVFCVYAQQIKTGKMVYAQAAARAQGELIELVFQATEKPFDGMKYTSQPIDSNADPSAFCVNQGRVFSLAHKPIFDQENEKIKRILVNLKLPSVDCLWFSLIYGVAQSIKHEFPNRKAEESAFNVHVGYKHFRADDQLIEPSSILNLKEK